jgi:hypothetical protein
MDFTLLWYVTLTIEYRNTKSENLVSKLLHIYTYTEQTEINQYKRVVFQKMYMPLALSWMLLMLLSRFVWWWEFTFWIGIMCHIGGGQNV